MLTLTLRIKRRSKEERDRGHLKERMGKTNVKDYLHQSSWIWVLK